jgi:hypothetical protein
MDSASKLAENQAVAGFYLGFRGVTRLAGLQVTFRPSQAAGLRAAVGGINFQNLWGPRASG